MRSIGVLIVRLVVGGLLAGHGAQKLFGTFGGPGVEGTAAWLESLRLKPGRFWARVAGGSEFVGGLLTALGALNPLGPIIAMGSMLMATTKVHLGKPVWVTAGGAELPVTNMAVLAAMTVAGPGKLSVDGLLGIRIPRRVGLLAFAAMAGSVVLASREEIAQGSSDIDQGGGQVSGDPGSDDDAMRATMDAGSNAGESGSNTGGSNTGGSNTGGGSGSGGASNSASGPDSGSRAGTSVDAPTPSRPDMRGATGGVAVAAVGMRPSPEDDDISEELKTDVRLAEASGTTGFQGSELDDSYRVGEAGSDAGTSMGTGSDLGSETPEESI